MSEYKDEIIAETMTKLRLDLSLVRNVTYLHLTLYIPIFLLVVLTLVGNLIPGNIYDFLKHMICYEPYAGFQLDYLTPNHLIQTLSKQ